MLASLARLIAQEVSTSPGPLSTGAVFVALTGAVTYLYRARDRDRAQQIKDLRETIDDLRDRLDERNKRP